MNIALCVEVDSLAVAASLCVSALYVLFLSEYLRP